MHSVTLVVCGAGLVPYINRKNLHFQEYQSKLVNIDFGYQEIQLTDFMCEGKGQVF